MPWKHPITWLEGWGGSGRLMVFWMLKGLAKPVGIFQPAIFYCFVAFIWFKWGPALFCFFTHWRFSGLRDPGDSRQHCEPVLVRPWRLCASTLNNRPAVSPPPRISLAQPAAWPSAPLTHSSGFPHLQPVSYAKRAAPHDPRPRARAGINEEEELCVFFPVKIRGKKGFRTLLKFYSIRLLSLNICQRIAYVCF